MNAYKAGTLAASDVLTSLYNMYTAKRNAISIASRRMTVSAGLIKALGGGWKNDLGMEKESTYCRVE